MPGWVSHTKYHHLKINLWRFIFRSKGRHQKQTCVAFQYMPLWRTHFFQCMNFQVTTRGLNVFESAHTINLHQASCSCQPEKKFCQTWTLMHCFRDRKCMYAQSWMKEKKKSFLLYDNLMMCQILHGTYYENSSVHTLRPIFFRSPKCQLNDRVSRHRMAW